MYVIRWSIFIVLLSVNISCEEKAAPAIPEYIDCSNWVGWSNQSGVQCGLIEVPEDHENPLGKKIKIAFAKKRGDEGSSGHPTIYLTGGPGQDALSNMNRFQRDNLLQVGDVILVDQRGMGKSGALPDLGEATLDILAADLSLDQEQEEMAILMDSVRLYIGSKSIDLTKYNTTQNALDIGILMEALGYEKYNLWGGSYGTKLGAYIMKYFPDKIHASVLTAPAALDNQALENRFPDFVNALDELFKLCGKNPECKTQHENLRIATMRTLQNLKGKPMVITLADRRFTVNPQDAVFLIRYMLYRSDADQLLSDFVRALETENISEVERICNNAMAVFKGVNTTAFYSFCAYEEFSDETLENIELHIKSSDILSVAGLGWFQAFIPGMVNWHSGRIGEDEHKIENIEVPTLVITNTYDPVTPARNSEMFLQAIPGCQILNLGNFGHGAFTPCTAKIRREFLMNPGREIDESCL